MTEGELPTDVRAIITDEEGRFLLLRRAEGLKKYSDLWELPGGWVRPGESLPRCLERTVFEETGLTLDVCGCSGFCESVWEGKTEVHQIWVAHPQRKEVRLAPGHTSSTWAGRDEIEMFRTVPWLTDAVGQVF
ncbi:NUDIX hydrolase [Methanofollis ethanolicus]|uniref:NUDIX hydrolase n=1 Tax=Methanofollis ethanolicus TaxID=488124 RepID=UPI00082A9C4C|nr:NUDIX hydrolase [Methanofollis ethanolicus]